MAEPKRMEVRAAIIRCYPDDDTFGLRMLHYESEHLDRLKAEVRNISFDWATREWILWTDKARREAIEVLEEMGFRVAIR